ncbi:MAG: MFS transporter [Sphingobium sp.]
MILKNHDFRNRMLLAALIIPGVAATESFAILPVMLGIVARGWGLTDEMLGILASIELAGLALGTLAAVMLMRKWGVGRTAFRAMLMLMLANVAALMAPDLAWLMALRALAGLAAGAGLAICYVNLANTSHPERNFAVFTLIQLLLGAIGLFTLPFLADLIGWGAPYGLLGGSALLGMLATLLPLSPNDPDKGHPTPPANTPSPAPSASFRRNRPGFLALIGVGCYFIGITAVWAYMDRIGSELLLTPARIAMIVAASQIVAMAGAASASLLAGRLSLTTSLAAGSLMTVTGIIILVFAHEMAAFALAVAMISFAWNYVTAPQFAAVAMVDTNGALAGLMSTVTGVGAAAGPAFGSGLVGHGFTPLLVTGALLILMSLLLIWPACRPARTA